MTTWKKFRYYAYDDNCGAHNVGAELGRIGMVNNDDPHYVEHFHDRESVQELIDALIAARDYAFPDD